MARKSHRQFIGIALSVLQLSLLGGLPGVTTGAFQEASAEAYFDETAVVETPPFATSDFNTCAIKADGLLKCWGNNDSGQNNVPADLGEVRQVTIAAEGAAATVCAITDRQLMRCWGDNQFGQTNVPTDLGKVLSISAGGRHVCAINIAGLVRCWGRNGNGQASVPSDLGPVKQVSAGQWMTCAITMEDFLRCWGHGNYGDTSVPQNLGRVTRVSPGSEHVCVLNWTYKLVCWGIWWSDKDARAPEDLGQIPDLSSGGWNSCILTPAGQPKCFGYIHNAINVPPLNLPPLSRISSSWINTCASTIEDKLICWGSNAYGEIEVPSDINSLYSKPLRSNVIHRAGTDSYYYINVTPLNWDQARAQAQRMTFRGVSGNLANITSKDENDSITRLLNETRSPADSAWFGAKANSYGDFIFSDGSEKGQKTSYSNWNVGEPNNYDNHEFYAALKPDSTWNDYCDCRGLWSIVEFYVPNSNPNPIITGLPQIGETLSVDSGVTDLQVGIQIQWLRDGRLIPLENASSYKLTNLDYLHKISVSVTVSKPGTLDQMAISGDALVIKSTDRFTDLNFTGKAEVGSKLAVKPIRALSKFDYSYQWFRNDSPIASADESRYMLVADDLDAVISTEVCSRFSGAKVQCVKKTASGAIKLGAMGKMNAAITGIPRVDRLLTVFVWNQISGTSVTYRWQSEGIDIPDSTGKSYLVSQKDRGKRINVIVTFSKPGYRNATVEVSPKTIQ